MTKDRTTLTFTGDIGFDKYMYGKWNDEQLLAEEVLSFLRDTDHLIVNVEGPLSERTHETRSNTVAALQHSMNPEAAVFLKRIGANVWNLCNNHIMDAGSDGIEDTLALAKRYHALTLGAGRNLAEASKPLILPEAGGIGMIGVGYQRACRKAAEDTAGCFSWSDMERIAERIGEIRQTCRWCIVVAHGGEEFTALPSPYTRDRYLTYLDFGADLVVGHHPHVPMNYETVGDKVIFYSLGNFVFDTDYQRSQHNTEYGIFTKIHFAEDHFAWEPFGIRIDRETQRILPHSLPMIFTDVPKEEYEKLSALAAKMFIENTKRQLRFLRPAEFEHATEEDWIRNFYEPLRSGRVPGETLDFQILYPLSKQADAEAWKESRLQGVVEYMLRQLPQDA